MKLTRRDFLRLCGASGLALSVSSSLAPKIAEALERALEGNPPVIWIQGASCSGCSVSLINSVHPKIQDIIMKIITLHFHPTIMGGAGESAIEVAREISKKYEGKFYLVVEGAIPIASNGRYCVVGEINGREITMVEWVTELGGRAKAIMALGSCASFGGVQAASPNPTNSKSVSEVLSFYGIRKPIVNVPGCPPHSDWIIGTLSYLLLYGVPELDRHGRPKLFYGEVLHDNCPFRSYYEEERFAKYFGDVGCRYQLGCKGPEAHCDAWKRKFNNGANWCVENAICIGCTQPKFWDDLSPFYKPL